MHMQMFLRSFMIIETNQRPALLVILSLFHSDIVFVQTFNVAWCVDCSRELIEKFWVMQAAYRQESLALFK